MKVEIESNKSVKRIAMIDGNRLNFKAPIASSFRKTLLKSGRVKTFGGAGTDPTAQAISVIKTIVTRKANGFLRDIRKIETATPAIVSSAGLPSDPILTNVTGSDTMKPAFFNPMKVRNTPIPQAAAEPMSLGIAFAIDSRTGVTEISRKKTPAQKTIPK